MTERIYVVSAAIVNAKEKRLFVQRRSGKTNYAWHWVTPGGKVWPQEEWLVTLRRELFEEHRVLLRVSQLPKYTYAHEMIHGETGQPIIVYCYTISADMIEGEYMASGPAVAGFDWVDTSELETLMLGPADHANRGKLLELIR